MKYRTILTSIFLPLLFAACSGFFLFRHPDDFIRVRGIQLMHNGKPYYFGGTNLWYACYLGSPGETGDRARLLRELDTLCANGLVNVRMLAASESSSVRRSVKPAIQRRPGEFDNDLLAGLDFVLAEMAERDMHAVLYLNNYWEWSGGMSQYAAWSSGGGGVDPEDTTKGWQAFMNYSATFYANHMANALFRDYVKSIVTRTNSMNGRSYTEDPTIMAWQLANEPRPGTLGEEGRNNLPDFYRWIDQTAAYIHSLDTNHLVSTGSEGSVGCLMSAEYFLESHKTPNVDYLTFHLWPYNWGWFDPTHAEETLPVAEANSFAYIAGQIALARQLRKPIVMEEFGLGRDGGVTEAGSPTISRDRFYKNILSVIVDSACAGAPIAGSNFWAWGGEGRGQHADHMWRRGDPYVGDPPQEPQGLNSVFSTDTSTLRIIRRQALKMLQLSADDSLYAQRVP